MRKEVIGSCTLILGDCREIMPTLSGGIHSCVTDPPYHLTSIVQRFGSDTAAAAKSNGASGVYKRASSGFMGAKWDGGDISFDPETWKLVYSTLLPGAHLVSFAGTRTYHRIAMAIDDAGFEVRDMLCWITGQGFPKAKDVGKAIDEEAEVEREVIGVAADFAADGHKRKANGSHVSAGFNGSLGDRWSASVTIPATEAAKEWDGWFGGNALKPSFEPICLARKPLSETAIHRNVLKHGTGAINVDACRVEAQDAQLAEKYHSVRNTGPRENSVYGADNRNRGDCKLEPHDLGRWPANVLTDQSLEVLKCFAPEHRPAIRFFYSPKTSAKEREEGLENFPRKRGGMVSNTSGQHITRRDGGEPGTRANHHPTVKPIDLMAWLVRLITPPNGVCLDPFMGSGSTGIAAVRQGFRFIGIEQSEEYFEIACARVRAAIEKPDLFIEPPREKPVQIGLNFDEAAA